DGDVLVLRPGELLHVAAPRHAGFVLVHLVHAVVDIQDGQHFTVHAGSAQGIGHHVDALKIVHGEDALHRHVGVHADLLANLLTHGVAGPAGQDVGHDAHL